MSNKKEKQFREITEKYGLKVRRLCFAWCYDKKQIDDLYQEVMLNIWQSLDRYKGKASIGTWVYRVTVNTALTFNRKRLLHKERFGAALPDEATLAAPQENNEENERVEKLRQAMCKLTDTERLLIGLYLEELSYKDIADIMGITTNHVGVKINRVKNKLMRVYKNG